MNFDIRHGKTVVTTDLTLQRNPDGPSNTNELVLDGDETAVTLLSIAMDGKELVQGQDYTLKPGKLIVKNCQSNSKITTVVSIVPEDNTQLSGLYQSDGMYCTQCEALGFRRITYYPDRPDNMAVFERVRIEADRADYPLLLSNGNLVEEGDIADTADDSEDRHYAVWSDPHPKPSYLFATVAGKLGGIHDEFVTASGRKVALRLYSEPNNVDKLYYAMDSLKRSMKWDEDRFGVRVISVIVCLCVWIGLDLFVLDNEFCGDRRSVCLCFVCFSLRPWGTESELSLLLVLIKCNLTSFVEQSYFLQQ